MPRLLDPVNYPMDRFANYQLSDATANAKGAKSCKLESNGAQVIFNLGERPTPAVSPFGATSYGDDTSPRQTIEFRLTEEQLKHWEAFDTWAITYLHANCERIFKKQLTQEQLQESYRSPVTRKQGYEPHLRCKINTSGPKVARAWREQERIELPSNLRMLPVIPRITLSHLWMMSKEFGFVLSVNDILCL
jgi:hypothetical protein